MNRIVFTDSQFADLRSMLFDIPGVEGAAFILCGISRSSECTKLMAHSILPVTADEYVKRDACGLSITSRTLTRIAKLARHEGLSVVFAHSHPGGLPHFSDQDDREEKQLLPFLHSRVPTGVHGTLVLTEDGVVGRIYAPTKQSVDGVLVVGKQFTLFGTEATRDISPQFDRQVRAFGPEIQRVLHQLHVGIVGLGGIGSPLAEQLSRLGVGKLTLIDGDTFDVSNINRVYGSCLNDATIPKVEIAKRNIEKIGLGTIVVGIDEPITREAPAKALRDCDVVFGCTDKQIPRAILNQLALRYTIPVFDSGVLIDSFGGRIRGIHGRVTTLMAGEACLFCRGRISPEAIRIEALPMADRIRQAREGYAPELDEPAPAVIPFTSAIASIAVSELIHRLTGFMGVRRASSEVLIGFDESRIRTNRVEPRENCSCTDESTWGKGDETPYLGLFWPSHTK
jgi:molybdopterin/thiamine biosynthesis adenylyltransferase